MEVDRIADRREWPDGWHCEHSNQGETEEEHHYEKGGDEAYVQYIGKAGGKKGGQVSKDIAISVVVRALAAGLLQGQGQRERFQQ